MAASPIPARRFALGEREFVALMAASMSLQALAVDAMLPALGMIAHDMGVSDPNRRQLVIGVFLFAAGIGSLLPGSLSDRFGRRRVMLVCLCAYSLLSLVCALAPTFEVLLAARCAVALASAGLAVLPAAIIRDRDSGDRMARMLSTVAMVFMIAPMVAPTVGQTVLLFAGWRWIFAFLAVFALVIATWVGLRLPETRPVADRRPLAPGNIARAMLGAAFHPGTAGYVVGGSLTFGALLGYISSSQQLVAEHFGAGRFFPLLFGATALLMSSSSFVNTRIVERFGARRVSHAALFGFLLFSLIQLAQASGGHETLWQFMPVMALNACMLGFIGANFSSISLQPFARDAGAASSVQASLRMAIASTIGMVIGQSFDGTARPLALAFVICALVAIGLVTASERGRLFSRRGAATNEPMGQRGPSHDLH